MTPSQNDTISNISPSISPPPSNISPLKWHHLKHTPSDHWPPWDFPPSSLRQWGGHVWIHHPVPGGLLSAVPAWSPVHVQSAGGPLPVRRLHPQPARSRRGYRLGHRCKYLPASSQHRKESEAERRKSECGDRKMKNEKNNIERRWLVERKVELSKDISLKFPCACNNQQLNGNSFYRISATSFATIRNYERCFNCGQWHTHPAHNLPVTTPPNHSFIFRVVTMATWPSTQSLLRRLFGAVSNSTSR